MAKDPAFLFYPGDWLGGVITFTRLQKGAYIDLLMAQFNAFDGERHLSFEDIKTILGNDFPLWESKLKYKFVKDKTGKFFNEKLENEIIARRHWTGSRRDNKLGKKHKSDHMNKDMIEHMEDEDDNKDLIKDEKKKTPSKKNNQKLDAKKATDKKTKTESGLNFYNLGTPEFMDAWNKIIQTKKWKNKMQLALQMSLDKLKNYPPAFAALLVIDAIEKGWQGVVYDNVNDKLEKWKKGNKTIDEKTDYNIDFRGNKINAS